MAQNQGQQQGKQRQRNRGPQTRVYILSVEATPTAGKKDHFDLKVTLDVTAPVSFRIPTRVFVGTDNHGIVDVMARTTKSIDGVKLDLKQEVIPVRIEKAGFPSEGDMFELQTKSLKKSATSTPVQTHFEVKVGIVMTDGSNPVTIMTQDPDHKPATGNVIITCGLDFEVGSAGGWSSATLAVPYRFETDDSGVSVIYIKVPENCNASFFHEESRETINRILVKKR